MFNNIKRKIIKDIYVRNVIIKTDKMEPGIKRKLLRISGGAAELVKHRFKLSDYRLEIKKNNSICSFNRYGESITMYLPHFEEDLIQEIIARGADFFEADELEYLRNTFLQDGNVILDIGANIGNHTVFFSKICNAEKVYAFEPIAETYDTLCRNISLNHIEKRVVAYNVALGNVTGKAKIKKFDSHNIGGTQIEEVDDGNIVMKKLDDYEFERIDFVKIDVEGYEYNLLRGAESTLSNHSPIIFIEIFDDRFSQVDELLRSYGYTDSYAVGSSNNFIYKKG